MGHWQIVLTGQSEPDGPPVPSLEFLEALAVRDALEAEPIGFVRADVTRSEGTRSQASSFGRGDISQAEPAPAS